MGRSVAQANILLVEHSSFYLGVLYNFLSSLGARVSTAQDVSTAKKIIRDNTCDIAIVDITYQRSDFGLDLVGFIRDHYPACKIILSADGSIDTYLQHLKGLNVSILLSKPVKKQEFTQLIKKLYERENLFGLKNYLPAMNTEHFLKINHSEQIHEGVQTILSQAKMDGFVFKEPEIVNLVLQETLVNAVYHSYGFTQEKIERRPVELPPHHSVDVHYGLEKSRFGVSISDSMGTLSKEKIIDTLSSVVEQNEIINQGMKEGKDISGLIKDSGRGIDIIRKFAGEYIYLIRKGEKTESIIIFDSVYEKDDEFTSVKVIEV